MSGEPKTLTPEQEKAAREAFETRYKGFTWWTEKYGELHPALHKDENGDYLEESQRKYWKGFQEGYAAALSVPVEASDEASDDLTTAYMVGLEEGKDRARDEVAELREALRTLVTDLEDLMEESHVQLYDGNGALVDTSWGKLLQGGKDEYLSNWRDVKRLAGGGD